MLPLHFDRNVSNIFLFSHNQDKRKAHYLHYGNNEFFLFPFCYVTIRTFFPCPLFFSSFLYAFSFAFGTLMTAFAWMPLKAFLPPFFSSPDLIVILFSALQPPKALAGIPFTPFPITTLFRFLLPANACADIPLT